MMKRFVFFCLIVCLWLPSTSFATSGEVARCIRAATPPLVDGLLTEWGLCLPISLVSPSQILSGSTEWEGRSDASAVVYTMWDDSSLHIAAEVSDDSHVAEATGYECHANDGIHLCLDMNLLTDFDEISYSADDYHLGLMLEPEAGAVVYDWDHLRSRSRGGRIAVRSIDSEGYILEASIPWSELDYRPAPDGRLGFNIYLSDDDDPSKKGQNTFMGWNGRREAWKDPTQMGELVLAKSNEEDMLPLMLPSLPSEFVPVRVDAGMPSGSVNPLWEGLGQGGEANRHALESVSDELRILEPSLIRFDHIFSRYGIDATTENIDWSEADRMVDSIVSVGAKPLVCLSYMPASIARDGHGLNPPEDYLLWERLLDRTVRHFNQDRGLDIQYWEVWNEPDLPQFWNGSCEEYLEMYEHSVKAIKSADPSAKVGGPAAANMSYEWIVGLLEFCAERDLPLDFISWHCYNRQPEMVEYQIRTVREWVDDWGFEDCELILDEWNVTTLMDGRNDAEYAAAFAVDTIHRMQRAGLDRSCFFEVVDGPSADGREFWGRWGLITASGIRKATYNAFQMMSKLGDESLLVECEHPYMNAVATTSGNEVAVLVWHLDLSKFPVDRKIEVTIDNLNLRPPVLYQRFVLDSEHANAFRLGEEQQYLEPLMTINLDALNRNYRFDLESPGVSLILLSEM